VVTCPLDRPRFLAGYEVVGGAALPAVAPVGVRSAGGNGSAGCPGSNGSDVMLAPSVRASGTWNRCKRAVLELIGDRPAHLLIHGGDRLPTAWARATLHRASSHASNRNTGAATPNARNAPPATALSSASRCPAIQTWNTSTIARNEI
jgi:hypothetical protein